MRDRLHQVGVESGRVRLMAVASLAPAGDGDEEHRLAGVSSPQASRRLQAVEGPACPGRAARRAGGIGRPRQSPIRRRRPCARHDPAWRAVAPGCRRCRDCRRRRGRAGRAAVRATSTDTAAPTGAASIGSTTVKRLPRRPSLSTSTRPPCSSTSPLTSARPIPRPPCDGRWPATTGRTSRRHAAASPARCQSPRRAPRRRPCRWSASRSTARGRRRRRTSTHCSTGWRRPAPAAPGRRRSHTGASGSTEVTAWRWDSSRGRVVSSAASSTSRSVTRSRRSSSRLRVIRETSSRSSSSRAMC